MSKHTAGKLAVHKRFKDMVCAVNEKGKKWVQIANMGHGATCFPGHVASRPEKEMEANAEHIVHCWNTHDGLVEALKEIAKDGCPADIEIAKQTLAKIEEE